MLNTYSVIIFFHSHRLTNIIYNEDVQGFIGRFGDDFAISTDQRGYQQGSKGQLYITACYSFQS